MNRLKLFTIAAVLFPVFAACSETGTNEPSNDPIGENNFDATVLSVDVNSFPEEELSEQELSGLKFMREEEKLARDIYIKMYEQWKLRVFNNISKSEQTHMNAIKSLLDKYEIEDPASETEIGVFSDDGLEELYNQLLADGQKSYLDALKVGALIEEVDIIDLMNEIENVVDNQDIKFVYENLLKASGNHLNAFVKNLSTRGIEYSPQKLDPETYAKILNGEL